MGTDKDKVKNILVIRTDRIGEVILSTPILTALRMAFPHAKICMMVKPEIKGLIEDNPNVDEIIEYEEKQSSDPDSQSGQVPRRSETPVPMGVQITKLRSSRGLWLQAFRLAQFFKQKKFDIIIIVNPKKEFHLAAFLAGIPIRVGFDRKWAFLLTHRVKDLKFLAERHEVEYNLDLVRILGIEPADKRPYLAVGLEQFEIERKLGHERLLGGDSCLLAAIHPSTSNPKKQWPKEYFAKLADLLIKNGYNTVIVSGNEGVQLARDAVSLMKERPVDLSGKTTLKELAALFKRCEFLVSGDSGPIHIAAAVGTPVIALFGKQDPGSRPERWGPYGRGHIILQKERLEDITPEEVIEAIRRVIKVQKV